MEHASENELLVRVPNMPDEQQCRIKVSTPTSSVSFTDYFERWYKWKRIMDSIPGHNHYGEKCGNYFYMFNFTVKDMFRFNLKTGESNPCSPIPTNFTDYTFIDASFCCNGKLYFMFNSHSDLWEYNPDNDLWSIKRPCPGGLGYYLEPFIVDEKAYIPVRTDTITDLFEYNPLLDLWTKKSSFPGDFYTNGPLTSNGFSISSANMGYVGTPRKIYQYNPDNDEWTYLTEYPGEGILNVSGFYINNKIYIGLGQLDWETNVMRDVWCFNPSTLQWEKSASFPLPGKKEVYISLISSSDGYVIKHYNSKKMQLFHFNPERE